MEQAISGRKGLKSFTNNVMMLFEILISFTPECTIHIVVSFIIIIIIYMQAVWRVARVFSPCRLKKQSFSVFSYKQLLQKAWHVFFPFTLCF